MRFHIKSSSYRHLCLYCAYYASTKPTMPIYNYCQNLQLYTVKDHQAINLSFFCGDILSVPALV